MKLCTQDVSHLNNYDPIQDGMTINKKNNIFIYENVIFTKKKIT